MNAEQARQLTDASNMNEIYKIDGYVIIATSMILDLVRKKASSAQHELKVYLTDLIKIDDYFISHKIFERVKQSLQDTYKYTITPKGNWGVIITW